MSVVEPKTDSSKLTATHWSVVLAAGREETTLRLAALETLCGTYWYSLYCFARRLGSTPEDAQDLTQAFFANFLEKNYVTRADPERGRFRTFLLTAFKNFVTNEWKRAQTIRRGGACQAVTFDTQATEARYASEALSPAAPDQAFDRTWAVALFGRAMSRLRNEYASAGKSELYEYLKIRLWGEQEAVSYTELAGNLNLSEAAVKMAVVRLRRRFSEAIRREVEQTVADPKDVDGEVRYLISVLRD